MKRNHEIIIIEDDEDDRNFLKDIFESLGYPNKVVFIEDPTLAITYLSSPDTNPFIIFSDINMPKIDGFELRRQILANADISQKCVPYIFLSTSKNPENVKKAYSYHVQGYFSKEENFPAYKLMIQNIMEYWLKSLSPVFSS
ncbi:response regulator [Flavobacterium sp. KACC 22758]|jgi:CheY-like chemotaxis protein|uniref:response regulator n=1 Tax=Flavobacterium sp. KACC 22758 TaxID=3025667 RepID=UPI0023660B3F|nr:response regulator [Flavobacterium sp. KACC 22758]WDF57585.1 response regulator [Flavobacterium sp. KACC 22758]